MSTRHLETCPNCHQVIEQNYCPACGQSAVDYRASLRQLVRDFFVDYLNLDSRLFRTVVPLLFKPGYLTREYMDGRRQRYIKPIRLYLVATIVSLLIISIKLTGALSGTLTYEKQADKVIAEADTSVLLNSEIYHALTDSVGWTVYRPSIARKVDVARSRTRRAARDSTVSVDSLRAERKTASYFFNSMGRQMSDPEFRANLFSGLLASVPKIMFFFLPVFALLLKLFYIRRDRYYVEHLIFALHLHAFLFLIIAATVTIPFIHPVVPALVGPLYLIVGLRRIYGQGWLKTIFKGILVFFLYQFLISILFGVGLILQGVIQAAETEGVSWWQLLG